MSRFIRVPISNSHYVVLNVNHIVRVREYGDAFTGLTCVIDLVTGPELHAQMSQDAVEALLLAVRPTSPVPETLK